MNKKQLIVAWVVEQALRTLLCLFLLSSVICFANDIADKKSTEGHVIDDSGEWREEAVIESLLEQRLEKSAQELKSRGSVERFTHFDYALPADEEEYRALDKNAILAIFAVTHKKEELPLQRVYIDWDGKQVQLEQLFSLARETKGGVVKEVFGDFREDSYYLMPIHLLSRSCRLVIDWAQNRDGFVLQSFPSTKIEEDFIKADKNQEEQKGEVERQVVKEILVREYNLDLDASVDWDKIEAVLYDDLKTKGESSDAEIHQAIGHALLQGDNQWERATVHFKKAVELDPKLYFSWYNLGLINADSEEGYDYFKKTTEANPEYSPSYYWMAYYRCRNREDKKAIPLFQKYLEVAKGDKNETGRIKVAKEVLQDLLAGREGKNLSMMRRPTGEE